MLLFAIHFTNVHVCRIVIMLESGVLSGYEGGNIADEFNEFIVANAHVECCSSELCSAVCKLLHCLSSNLR